MKKRTGSDQTLSKSLFSYIVYILYIYIPTPDFSSQATTQSVLSPPFACIYHDNPSYPVPPPPLQWRQYPTLSLTSPLFSILSLYLCFYTEQHYENKRTFLSESCWLRQIATIFFNTFLSHEVKTVSSSALGDIWARSFFSCFAIGISKF